MSEVYQFLTMVLAVGEIVICLGLALWGAWILILTVVLGSSSIHQKPNPRLFQLSGINFAGNIQKKWPVEDIKVFAAIDALFFPIFLLCAAMAMSTLI